MDKTKAVARCASCETVIPIRVTSDETIEPIGITACCEEAAYEVLELN